MGTEIRIVAAVAHNETNEVEIVMEKTKVISDLKERTTLHTIWIDCEKELDDLLEGGI